MSELRYQAEPIDWLMKQSRPDWLLAVLSEGGADRVSVMLAALDCARLALPVVPRGEERPRMAIEAAEAFARGDGSRRAMLAAAESLRGLMRPNGGPLSALARAVSLGIQSATQPSAAHASLRQTAVALAGAVESDTNTARWRQAFAESHERCMERLRAHRWRVHPPSPELVRCRPNLQVAWDLVSERQPDALLTTRQVLESFRLRQELEALLENQRSRERALVRGLAERMAAAPDLAALQAIVREMLQ